MKRIEFRVADEAYKTIEAAAARYSLPVATFCRMVIFDKLADLRVDTQSQLMTETEWMERKKDEARKGEGK